MRVGRYDTDEQLLADWKLEKQEAFAAVYQRFHQRLYFFALRFVSEADAKDAVADVFVGLWQKQGDFDNVSAIGRFLFLGVRNRCLNVVRHELVRHQKHAEILHLLETSEEAEVSTEDVTTALVQLIYKEIEKLPARMREVFLLSYQEGLKPAAIAEKLQISVQTVSNQKLSALRLLRAALGDRAQILYLLILLSTAQESLVVAQ